MAEMIVILDDAQHKIVLANAAGTTAPPSGPTDGQSLDAWRGGSAYAPRRAAVRFTAAAALTLSAISIWVYFDGAWSKLARPADVTFVTGDLSATIIVDFPFGSRIAAAFTVSASNVTVNAYPLETLII